MPTIKHPSDGHHIEVSDEAAAAFGVQAAMVAKQRAPRVTHDGHHLIDIPPCPSGCKLSQQTGTVVAPATGKTLAVIDWTCSCGAEWQVTHPIVLETMGGGIKRVPGQPLEDTIVEKKVKTPSAYLAVGDVLDVRSAPPKIGNLPHFVIRKNLTDAELAKLAGKK